MRKAIFASQTPERQHAGEIADVRRKEVQECNDRLLNAYEGGQAEMAKVFRKDQEVHLMETAGWLQDERMKEAEQRQKGLERVMQAEGFERVGFASRRKD